VVQEEWYCGNTSRAWVRSTKLWVLGWYWNRDTVVIIEQGYLGERKTKDVVVMKMQEQRYCSDGTRAWIL
jgi:hypothetical protein